MEKNHAIAALCIAALMFFMFGKQLFHIYRKGFEAYYTEEYRPRKNSYSKFTRSDFNSHFSALWFFFILSGVSIVVFASLIIKPQ